MNNLKKIAQKKYLEFSTYEGSQHIATEHAIYRILENIKLNNSKNILEIGLGIGTIYSSVYVLNDKIHYTGTENNDFCLNSLRNNLKNSYHSLNIYDNIFSIKDRDFDLIIIDGKDESIETLSVLAKDNCVLIIEGDRKDQERKIKKMYPKSIFVHIISLKKNNIKGVFESSNYQGGVKVFFSKPNLKQFLYCYKHKVLTFIKYKIRKIKKI